jgi:hypothetical protein
LIVLQQPGLEVSSRAFLLLEQEGKEPKRILSIGGESFDTHNLQKRTRWFRVDRGLPHAGALID